MQYFKINNTDYSSVVQSIKVDKEFLTSRKSGRNAQGNSTIDLVNKEYKVTVKFAPMTEEKCNLICNKLEDYVVTIHFENPWTKTLTYAQCYIGTPSIEYYTLQDNKRLVKSFTISFIEL